MAAKKIVVKSAIEDEKAKAKAMKLVAGVEGVDSVAADMKEQKLTIIGSADPVFLTAKLRRLGYTELLSVGPAKEEKKDEKKPDAKKDDKPVVPTVVYIPDYNPYPYSVVSEESSNSCTIL